MSQTKILHWFRQDLRLNDNPAFYRAAQEGVVLPIYILDDENAGKFKMGAASRWWLHHALQTLNQSLENHLCLFKGDAIEILAELCQQNSINKVFWNRCYEPWRIQRDTKIKANLESLGIDVESYNGSLLWEPWENLKADGTPYKVFTPFYRKGCLNSKAPRRPLGKPAKLNLIKTNNSLKLADLNLIPAIPWYKDMQDSWDIGEKAAEKRLKQFLQHDLDHYKTGRDFPAQESVSRLSPHLHFGEISPNQIWYAAKDYPSDNNLEHFLSELAWREFSHSLLYHFPDLPWKNLQSKFDKFPWKKKSSLVKKWQKGLTGFPIVDAGMRELWQTGYMHNRVRMIVASFLVKNLLIHWHHGEQWFWNCLVDADLANNSASWQWVAGCGADAAPYFRIFNPVTQGQKFDPDGEYTLKYVPELAKLPKKYLFNPWEAPQETLENANIKLGKTYPKPIVELAASREAALIAFKELS